MNRAGLTAALIFILGGTGWATFSNLMVNNDGTTQVHNEEQIVANPTNPNNLVAVWRDFRLTYRQVAFAATFDQWQTLAAETLFRDTLYPRVSDPGLTVDANGNFYAVTLGFTGSTSEPNGLFVYKSTDGGRTWGPQVPVVNQVPGAFEDKELIACDRTPSAFRGNLYVSWTRYYNMNIMLARSTNGGASFQPPVMVSDAGYAQWSVPAVGPDGEAYVAWVSYNSDQIFIDRSTNGGATWGADRVVQSVTSADRYLGGWLWVFSYPAFDVDITNSPFRGNLYIAFMDGPTGDLTNIYFTRSTDGGVTWSARKRLNDDTTGVQTSHFHPWLAVSPEGTIHAIFYDRRNDRTVNNLTDVYYTQSTDGGTTWTANERVTSVSSDLRYDSLFVLPGEVKASEWDGRRMPMVMLPSGAVGEYNGLAATSNNTAVPIWTDTRDRYQAAYVGVRTVVGTWEERRVQGLRGKDQGLSVIPNPMREGCAIRWSLSTASPIGLRIYDISGRAVRSFSTHSSPLTSHSLYWDGKDDSGNPVPSGIYLLRAGEGDRIVTGKAIVTR